VIRSGKELGWGQYRGIKGVVAVAFSRTEKETPPLADAIKCFPFSGASAVLVYGQQVGKPFFSPDGKSIDAGQLDALRGQLDAICKFDMLPIVVLFDPDPSCRLNSSQAYAAAVKRLLHSVGQGRWYLLCLSDQADSERWREGRVTLDGVKLVRGALRSVRATDPKQVVAAGGSSAACLHDMVTGKPQVDVLMRRVDRLATGRDRSVAWDRPRIDVVDASHVTAASLRDSLVRVGIEGFHEHFPYGIALHVQDVPAGKRAGARNRLLARLARETDAMQKEILHARRPLVGDTYSLQPGEAEEGFVSLFNGRDLAGWVPMCVRNDFVVEDGVIRPNSKQGGHLRSWRPYGDFIFRGEYWIEAGGNSGFFMRAPLVGRCSRIGFESQIEGDSPGHPLTKTIAGSIYDVRPPTANYWKPNAWNDVEVTCIGDRVKIVWNGKLAHDFRYADIDFAKNRATRGYIGLQDHHSRVKFRKLRIKRLD